MKPNIVIFGTPTCAWCKKVKEYIKSRGFTFKYVDVSTDGSALRDMVRKTGQQGVPQLWIDNVAVVGFDRTKIDNLLSKTNK
ncbi:MAG TPA: glutaredoxin domain-containing protein [Candidatus Cloacimonadota bacterium]|nr:glutaredoxin domain-containing protein [Candidatus Cloacimonadota bacterium]